jgi:hypothetical protein
MFIYDGEIGFVTHRHERPADFSGPFVVERLSRAVIGSSRGFQGEK